MQRYVEGFRALPTRTAVWLRYAAYLLTILGCSAITQACFTGQAWRNGGWFMLIAATLMTSTAAVGTWFFTNHRRELIEQMRHYVFGIAVLPGTSLAVLHRAAQTFFQSPAAQSDPFLANLNYALPILFFCTVVIPAAVFIKQVAGMRTLHRSRMDDEELLAALSRQDGMQR